jgi:hypothetical protein
MANWKFLIKRSMNRKEAHKLLGAMLDSKGDEVLRTPFREARLSVVLLRPGYGEKMWTGVERTAIGETCQSTLQNR